MSTRDEILEIGDTLIRDKGFNAFSFADIAVILGIKTASVHYHFATKTALGLAVVKQHIAVLEELVAKTRHKGPLIKLQAFFSLYSVTKAEDNVCIVGSLATDLHTVEPVIQEELKIFVNKVISWVTEILEEGKLKKVFSFHTAARAKALIIITNMLASVQLTRLTQAKDFDLIKKTIIKELKA